LIVHRVRRFAKGQDPERVRTDLNAVIFETSVLLDFEARRFGVTPVLEFDRTLADV